MINKNLLPYITSGALIIATNTVSYFEGRRYTPYLDVAGVLTVCEGITKDIKNKVYTDKECDVLLRQELDKSFAIVYKYVSVPLTETQKAALASFVYNVGESNFRRSTLLRKLNNKDYLGACKELDRWVFAGGRKWLGLINRRNTEKWLCMYKEADKKKEVLND
ncbi:lysozyme [Taylorella equigenitalis]|uniref:lysozyme n=1 Tax=Taylorella equigenitalis TaxID=29575 RepID=UPI0006C279D2|nr:lysozyme [Taylorella equigenitalis]ASY30179.1 lysozyme [Taylorella equigenitalis]KOS58496.1 lysozyme [Taylorella equigenitalis]